MRIMIVGGGSAGWITANVLNAVLNGDTTPSFEIILLEAPDIPIIGVGEATVPSIRRTLQTIGIPEREFMRGCEATFKNAIRFVDWNPDAQYDHPFDRRQRPETDSKVRSWLTSAAQTPFDKTFSLLSHLSDHNRAPKAVGWPDYGSTFPYAYHLDAAMLANMLANWGVARGIKHKKAFVRDVEIGADSNILAVTTDTEERLSADLYVDCTGFRARLIGEALGVSKQHYEKNCLCDRAATMRVPYDIHRLERLRPYTLATARAAGWSWDINLTSRRGLGYVYSSAFLSEDEAETELRAFEGAHTDNLEVGHIRFETSKRVKSWTGNCVAVGLADGFLEPLESSGLYMIEFAAQALSELIPGYRLAPSQTASHFNCLTQGLYEEVLDFINLHYVTSLRRDTPFWMAATDQSAVLDSLSDRLELWRTRPPSDLDFALNQRLFSLESYEFILFGMGYCAYQNHALDAGNDNDISSLVDKCLAKLPTHEEWLRLSL